VVEVEINPPSNKGIGLKGRSLCSTHDGAHAKSGGFEAIKEEDPDHEDVGGWFGDRKMRPLCVPHKGR